MATLRQARTLALSLPEATEKDHHGMVSFRVRDKIFATVPDNGHLRIMVDQPEILAAVAEHPDSCEPFYWGRRLACVVVTLAAVDAELLRQLLTEAWLTKAPESLRAMLSP